MSGSCNVPMSIVIVDRLFGPAFSYIPMVPIDVRVAAGMQSQLRSRFVDFFHCRNVPLMTCSVQASLFGLRIMLHSRIKPNTFEPSEAWNEHI